MFLNIVHCYAYFFVSFFRVHLFISHTQLVSAHGWPSQMLSPKDPQTPFGGSELLLQHLLFFVVCLSGWFPHGSVKSVALLSVVPYIKYNQNKEALLSSVPLFYQFSTYSYIFYDLCLLRFFGD